MAKQHKNTRDISNTDLLESIQSSNVELLNSIQVANVELLEFIQQNVAMKEDLKDFPTKKDPKGFITEDYLNSRLKEYATKNDLKTEITEAKNEILTTFDKFAKRFTTLEIEHGTLRLREGRRDMVFAKKLNLSLREIDSQ